MASPLESLSRYYRVFIQTEEKCWTNGGGGTHRKSRSWRGKSFQNILFTKKWNKNMFFLFVDSNHLPSPIDPWMTWLIINSKFCPGIIIKIHRMDGWIEENGYPLLVYLLYYLDFLQQDNCAGSPFVWEDRERETSKELNHQSDAMMLDDGPLDKFLLESKKKMGGVSWTMGTENITR